MEEMLGRLSLFLSSSQDSPFSGFQSPASQVDDSQPGTSGPMQKPGQAGPAGATDREVEMVPASATDTNTTGGCHAAVPSAGKAVHGALGTFCTVYGSGVGNSHWSTMPGGRPTTQDMEVSNCQTVPMPSSQTPIWDIDGGVCHTAPMPGSQPLISLPPPRGFIRGSRKEMPSAPGTSGSVYGVGVGNSLQSTMPGGHPTTQEMEVGVCHTAPMTGGQTPFQDVEVGVYHMAPMPGGMPGGQPIIPSHGLGISETIPHTLGVELGAIISHGLLPS
ncbi:hypothetical protein E2C01_067379 [Portunus trituberculatus]|uniref:Uncharacterized protein n=1 Tax=Portunus trituberculatus TaxID=210409 RepID=A0A5B7HJM5_PORTR|nr:hypothetical protein [Portunus trituberculatus]